MLQFFVLLSVIVSGLSADIPEGVISSALEDRIIGGQTTYIEYFPWQISLELYGRHNCGGSILSSNIILTAAHCLQNVPASALKVRAGSSYLHSGGMLISVAAYVYHENYNNVNFNNDVGVIRLSAHLSFSSTIKPIKMAVYEIADGTDAVVSGWGSTNYDGTGVSSQLKSVSVTFYGSRTCQSNVGAAITASMICAYNLGGNSCKGDSGGPLVSGNNLVGIVSWAYGCANANSPTMFSSVAYLRDWVIRAANSI